MFADTLRKILRARRIAILAILLLGAVYSMFQGPINRALAPTCPDPPALVEGTTPEIAALLSSLHAAELLYCPEIPPVVTGLGDRLYWGSDGLNSVLYVPRDPEANLVLRSYVFNDLTLASPGGRPPPRFVMPGRPVYRHQGPEGAGYFYMVMGPPTSAATSISVEFAGSALTEGAAARRDFYRDLESVWGRVTGSSEPPGSARVRVFFAVVPERWATTAVEVVEPPFDEVSGFVGDVSVDAPTLYRTIQGPTGAAVWVSGVVTGTVPTLSLFAPDGTVVEPWYTQRWSDRETGVLMLSAAFEPLAPARSYQILYRARSEAPATELGRMQGVSR